jgi:NAD(P)-dependent dehydrogenase (short-subunit alcohol dehydrogenase family)
MCWSLSNGHRVPALIAAQRAAIAITSSAQGVLSESRSMTPYVTTRAALVGMAQSLAAYV